ncbi:hypothetical protein H4R18_001941 [Coemansia javaensis]|uniref:Uncharacterized protein n=1 Tax=Coemansia javaensis TaxID=2761396 RepID=A0A9W8LJW9_9FUNG|nr:hypothetical protein H4R18_001941 [Coemansia javaensis]
MAGRQRAESSDTDSDDSGQLWLAPRLSPASTASSSVSPGGRAAAEGAAPSAAKPAVPGKRGPAAQDRQARERRLSAVQMAAWYMPRILLLFFVGWSWAVGVRFIHASEAALVAPAYLVPPAVVVPAGPSAPALTASLEADYDTSDPDDSDAEDRWRGVGGGGAAKRGGSDSGGGKSGSSSSTSGGGGGLPHDAIARVLQTAVWSGSVSGLMTVAVGLGHPFLDWRWQSQPWHTVEWNDVLRCAGGFLGVNYAALKLPFESAHQSAAITLIIALGLWTVCDGTLHGLLLSATAALATAWALCMHALVRPAAFSHDDLRGLLAHLPAILFTYWVMVGSIGRRLGHHPQWRELQRRRRRRRDLVKSQ